MLHSWRWYGPDDPVSLPDVRQAGATGVVTALHHVPNGAVWTTDAIRERQRLIAAGSPPATPLHWAVVESVPVHEDIKTAGPNRDRAIAAYQQTLRNLAECGVRTVCYNFMPVVDWTRTDLAYAMPDGSRALRFDRVAMAAFELHILQRPGAAGDYEEGTVRAARTCFDAMTPAERDRLTATVIAGLPGSEESYTLDAFRAALGAYRDVDADALRDHLVHFLHQIVPVAEECGVRLAIHPDDPPFPILGLPRVVSTETHVRALFDAVDSDANGLTFCTGSFGVREDNDLPGMVRRLGDRIHFIHLRSTRSEPTGGFHEADHLDGDVDMFAVVSALLAEEERRREVGRSDAEIPMRPDHGHQMLDDLTKHTNPGYSAIGRLRGLAELRGLELGIRRSAAFVAGSEKGRGDMPVGAPAFAAPTPNGSGVEDSLHAGVPHDGVSHDGHAL